MDKVQIYVQEFVIFFKDKFETLLFGSDLDLFIPMQCCESEMFIPDPNFFHPGFRIRIKEFKYFILTQKIDSKLSEI